MSEAVATHACAASATAALPIEWSFVLLGYLIGAKMLCSSGRG